MSKIGEFEYRLIDFQDQWKDISKKTSIKLKILTSLTKKTNS